MRNQQNILKIYAKNLKELCIRTAVPERREMMNEGSPRNAQLTSWRAFPGSRAWSVWWLILSLSLTRLQGAQVEQHFCLCLCG
jgi:hypothetical protein